MGGNLVAHWQWREEGVRDDMLKMGWDMMYYRK